MKIDNNGKLLKYAVSEYGFIKTINEDHKEFHDYLAFETLEEAMIYHSRIVSVKLIQLETISKKT